MVNIQEEVQKQNKLREAMEHIESDMTLSFHHWSVELDIDVSTLQKAWAKYYHEKRGV